MTIKSDNNDVYEIALKAIQQTNTLISFWDGDLLCRFINNSCLLWMGRKPEDIINKIHINELLGHHLKKTLKYIDGALSGKKQIFNIIIDNQNAAYRKVSVTYTPEIINHKVVGFYSNLVDITTFDTKDEISISSGSCYTPNPSGQILDGVEENLKSNLLSKFPGIATLAKIHMVSESKLKRDFKEKYEVSIFAYYRSLQMKLAEEYIKEKKYTKSQLGMMFNFSNPSNFSTCYNKHLLKNEKDKSKPPTKLENIELFSKMNEQSKLAIGVLDKNLCFLDVSENWIKYHGLNNIELIGSEILKVQNISENLKKSFNKSLEGMLQEVDEHFRIENGSSNMTNWNISPWRNANGEIQGLSLITTNITCDKNQLFSND